MDLLQEFQKVGRDGVAFRGVPFWSWNDDLQPEEVRRQLKEMRRAGLGGAFMHSRVGLITPYLGARWMECVRETVDEARLCGVKAWLYDEDLWPSGTGGGAVPAKGEAYQQKELRLQEIHGREFKPGRNTVAVFVGRRVGCDFRSLRRVPPEEAMAWLRQGERIYHFHYFFRPEYVDLLSRRVTAAFIESTHERYAREVGGDFGKIVPGIFTDEPNYCFVPWSPELPVFFQERTGYDVRDVLPALFGEYGDSERYRYDFWSAVTALFVESFTRPLSEWCARHGIALTGHFLGEDSLGSQVSSVGAAMRHYEYMQIPGIDHLMRRIGDPLLCKQASSVARQLGGRRVLSEMFGCSGWNVSFEELKWIAEWQFVQGVDLPCQHLALYSSRGCRKRDYPPSLFYQQPWWGRYRVLNDYFARLLFALTRGSARVDILLLHPIESAWALASTATMDRVARLNSSLVELTSHILGTQHDFDFGDEELLARYGAVEEGRLKVGNSSYSTVILPPVTTLRSTTITLLERFVQAGGRVLYQGEPPQRVDGPRSDLASALYKKARRLGASYSAVRRALERVPAPVVLREGGRAVTSVYVQHRTTPEREILFLANTDRQKEHTCSALFRLGPGQLELWNCETGEAVPLPARARRNGHTATLRFPPMGSFLIVLNKRAEAGPKPPERLRTFKRITLPEEWGIRGSDPNVITLDFCRYRAGGGRWQRLCPTMHLEEKLRYNRSQIDLALKYEFHTDFEGRAPRLTLVMEEPQDYSIEINERRVPSNDAGWWRDISFRKIVLPDVVKRKGLNEIVIRRPYVANVEHRKRAAELPFDSIERNRLRYGIELESIYLLGNFRVDIESPVEDAPRDALVTKGRFVLRDAVTSVKTGDLVTQGFSFYAGYVDLSTTIKMCASELRKARSALLQMAPPFAVVTEVRVNGKQAGVRGWRPYEFELKPYLRAGSNTITIRLYGSCRNLLGPHHHVDGELYAVGPDSFRGISSWTDTVRRKKGTWTNTYSFVKFGLYESPVIELRS